MSCWNPFEELRCNPAVYTTCCPSWIDKSMWYGQWGKNNTLALKASPWEVWNNLIFQQLRENILAEDFSTCDNCDKIFAGHLENTIEPWMKPILEVPPKRLWLEHDRHCNLKCPSCRPNLVLREEHQDQRDIKIKEICEEFMPTATRLIVMTSGEPLVSHSTLEILTWVEKYPNLEVQLFTNGQLLPDKWNLLPEKQITHVTISIDAATKETYEIVRRPGKWERILRALQFVKEKRKSGLVAKFEANFVVQAANFREIPKFAQLCIDHDVTFCFFSRLQKIHHTDEEFLAMDIHNPQNPQHQDFLEVIKDPILKDTIVWCPSFWEFVPELQRNH